MNLSRRAALLAAAGIGLPAGYLYLQSGSVPDEDMVLLDGSRHTRANFEGRVTLVNFWATSCTVCVAEMPAMADTFLRYRDRGFSLVAVAMQHDAPSRVVHFSQSRGLPFPVAIDNTGAVARAWGDVSLTPTSFLVNQNGRVVRRFQGAPDFAELRALIERTLAKG
jgi:peroxiredoxin